jgi:hypothetical protein
MGYVFGVLELASNAVYAFILAWLGPLVARRALCRETIRWRSDYLALIARSTSRSATLRLSVSRLS